MNDIGKFLDEIVRDFFDLDECASIEVLSPRTGVVIMDGEEIHFHYTITSRFSHMNPGPCHEHILVYFQTSDESPSMISARFETFPNADFEDFARLSKSLIEESETLSTNN